MINLQLFSTYVKILQVHSFILKAAGIFRDCKKCRIFGFAAPIYITPFLNRMEQKHLCEHIVFFTAYTHR